jgi:hypothetical protein
MHSKEGASSKAKVRALAVESHIDYQVSNKNKKKPSKSTPPNGADDPATPSEPGQSQQSSSAVKSGGKRLPTTLAEFVRRAADEGISSVLPDWDGRQ